MHKLEGTGFSVPKMTFEEHLKRTHLSQFVVLKETCHMKSNLLLHRCGPFFAHRTLQVESWLVYYFQTPEGSENFGDPNPKRKVMSDLQPRSIKGSSLVVVLKVLSPNTA